MWLSTWSLQEFSLRTAKVRSGGDHNSWEVETVIILPTSSSARWLWHIFNDGRSNVELPIRRADGRGLWMVYLQNTGSLESTISQPSIPCCTGAQDRWKLSHSMLWVLAVRTQSSEVTEIPRSPAKNKKNPQKQNPKPKQKANKT